MELDLDVPAWLNYAIVLAIALFASVREVDERLSAARERWSYGDTYILYFSYVAMPLLVFWLLDRVQAISDVSLASALLVAFSYQAIIIGGATAVAHPRVSALSQPILAWMDRLVRRIGELEHQYSDQLRDQVLRALARDLGRYPRLRQWAEDHADNLSALRLRMAQFEEEFPQPAANDELALRQWQADAAQRLLLLAKVDLRARLRLAWRGIVGWSVVFGSVVSFRRVVKVALPLLIVFLAVAGGNSWVAQELRSVTLADRLDTRWNDAAPYHLWRLLKTHNSARDLDRAQLYFRARLDCELARPSATAETSAACEPELPLGPLRSGLVERFKRRHPAAAPAGTADVGGYARFLVSLLEPATLPPDRAQRILDILLQGRLRADLPAPCSVLRLLPAAMATASRDNQSLIADAMQAALLIYRAQDPALSELPQTPSGDSLSERSLRVQLWSSRIDSLCPVAHDPQ